MKEISDDLRMLEYGLNEAYSDIFCFSTKRAGGYSTGNYASFNCNWYCGDRREDVDKNTVLLCNMLHIETDQLIMPHQVHQDRILDVDAHFMEMNRERRLGLLEGVDALICNQKGVCIGISTADCIPVVCYDPEHGVSAVIHAGWRGTVKRIVGKTMRRMAERYHSRVECIRAVIGPGISLNAFEVGDEVYDAFSNEGFDMEQIARKTDKWHIDLWEANRLQLLAEGVESRNIEVAGICTYDRYDEFFSARRLGIQSGRILTGILLKK